MIPQACTHARRSAAAVVLIMFILVSGCVNYGERKEYQIYLRAHPPESQAYLILENKWDQEGGELLMKNPTKLRYFEVDQYPKSAKAQNRKYIFAIMLGRNHNHMRISPKANGQEFSLNLIERPPEA
jgi:hypothetical protein